MSDSAGPALHGASRTVLLVDDDRAVLALFGTRLERAGFRVLKARSAPEALQAAQRAPRIDVLATDLVLTAEFRLARGDAPTTVPNGLVLMRQLLARHPDLKVVLFSGYSDETLRKIGQLPSRTAFLRKPFGPETLVHHIRQVLAVPAISRAEPSSAPLSPSEHVSGQSPTAALPRRVFSRRVVIAAVLLALGIGFVLALTGGLLEGLFGLAPIHIDFLRF